MREIIGDAKSGLFDVLAPIAYALLRLKYRDSIADAIADFGKTDREREAIARHVSAICR
jgi:hypothetical protein